MQYHIHEGKLVNVWSLLHSIKRLFLQFSVKHFSFIKLNPIICGSRLVNSHPRFYKIINFTLYYFEGTQNKASRTSRRVIYFFPNFRVSKFHHEMNDVARSKILTVLFLFAKLLNNKFVCSAHNVKILFKLKVFQPFYQFFNGRAVPYTPYMIFK